MGLRGIFRPGMRTYLIPLVAGALLVLSAFLPWVHVGDVHLKGYPDTSALWVMALGAIAVVLAALSLITRKNSRHPLLLVGLIALGIMFLSWRLMPRVIADRALIRSQALAIVENRPVRDAPPAIAGAGIYLGLAAACAIAAFGFTIVLKRVAQPYSAQSADDDVD